MRLGATPAIMAAVRQGETPAQEEHLQRHQPHRLIMPHGPERLQHQLLPRVSRSRAPELRQDSRRDSVPLQGTSC